MHNGRVDMFVVLLMSFLARFVFAKINDESEVKDMMGEVMDAVVNVKWENISHDRMTFNFPGVEPVYAPEIQKLLEGKVVFFLGNSNIRRLYGHVINSGYEFYPESSSHHWFLNDRTKTEEPGNCAKNIRHGGRWMDINWGSKPDANCRFAAGTKTAMKSSFCGPQWKDVTSILKASDDIFKIIEDLDKILGCALMPIDEGNLMEKQSRMHFQFTYDLALEQTLSFYFNFPNRTHIWRADLIIIQMNTRLKEVSQLEKFVSRIQNFHRTQDDLKRRRSSILLIDNFSTTIGTLFKADMSMEGAQSNYLTLKQYLETIPNVHLVPVNVGELRGHSKGLQHTRDSAWHLAHIGVHFHSQALLAIIRCLQQECS